jgi:crotonobetainyl-CoA:carnitine CoA-transferase CaiB-like acyl-CoA transferase
MMTANPLSGLTVVEIGTSVAAPVAGHILADLGALVVKVEAPGSGDDARGWGPPFDDGVAPVFRTLNRNKRSVEVNLKDAEACAALRRYILAEADVVIQNLRAGQVEKFGLGGAALRAEKPALIYCNLTAFGRTGPKRMEPGYDPMMQAFAGIMSVTGHEGADPVRVGPSLVDQGSGMWCVIGILSALLARSASGVGCEVDSSLYETALAWLPAQIATMLTSGTVPGKIGTENAGMAPYRAYQAADGWIVIAAGNDNLFGKLCRALGREDWLADEALNSNRRRVTNRVELNRRLGDVVAGYKMATLEAKLNAAGVPNAPVLALDEVIAHPQCEAVGILQEVANGQGRYVGLPLCFDGERPPLRTGAPVLGEANSLIFGPKPAA